MQHLDWICSCSFWGLAFRDRARTNAFKLAERHNSKFDADTAVCSFGVLQMGNFSAFILNQKDKGCRYRIFHDEERRQNFLLRFLLLQWLHPL